MSANQSDVALGDLDKQIRDIDKRVENNKHNIRYFWVGVGSVAIGVSIAFGSIWWSIPAWIESQVKEEISKQTTKQYVQEVEALRLKALTDWEALDQIKTQAEDLVAELRNKHSQDRFVEIQRSLDAIIGNIEQCSAETRQLRTESSDAQGSYSINYR